VSPHLEVHNARRVNGELLAGHRRLVRAGRGGNVRYFGENTAMLSGSLPVDLSGTWTGWVDCAEPAIII